MSVANIPEELIEQTLQKLGKTRAEFEQEVNELKKISSTEVIGNLMTVVMQSMDATANMLSLLMLQNMELKTEVEQLKGGMANG